MLDKKNRTSTKYAILFVVTQNGRRHPYAGYRSWLNMVEGFFSKMTRQMLRGIRVSSKGELADRIYKYFAEINEEPIVFHWKYNLSDIDVPGEIIVDTLASKKSS